MGGRSGSRTLRWLAVAFAANLLVSQVSAFVHLAVFPHRYCARHGAFEGDDDPARPPPAAGHRHPGEPDGVPADPRGGEHHRCPVMAFAQAPVEVVTAPPPLIVAGCVALLPRFFPRSLDVPGIPGLHLAPKASPPTRPVPA